MTDKIESFFGSSDETVKQEFLRNLKIRSIDQKFFYFGEGAKRYYESNCPVWPAEETFAMLIDHIDKKERIGFIGLACGRAYHDAKVMRLLQEAGYDFKFIGVDASEGMIQAAEETLSQEKFEYELWNDDITTYQFYERAMEETHNFDKIVFTFLGSTIGNMIQTEIVDTLFNLMGKDNLLMFDCLVRPSQNKLGDLELFNRYAKQLQDPQEAYFMLYPLEVLGIPQNIGTIILENIHEESVGVINFRYSFGFKEPYRVYFLNEYIHFLPPERIQLLDIRGYYPEKMTEYFQKHDFQLEKQGAKGTVGQYIFRKI